MIPYLEPEQAQLTDEGNTELASPSPPRISPGDLKESLSRAEAPVAIMNHRRCRACTMPASTHGETA